MSSEFDQVPDFEFESFDELADEMVDFDDESDSTMMRTAVLRKNNMVALLCIKSASEGAAICRVDPREDQPAVQIYDDPERALEWFTRSLRTSRRNGWDVIYDGLPLQG